ncbi:hypothetical protein D5266_08665 [bacterium c-19]|nr:hypothetical protein [bacterium c-19]
MFCVYDSLAKRTCFRFTYVLKYCITLQDCLTKSVSSILMSQNVTLYK